MKISRSFLILAALTLAACSGIPAQAAGLAEQPAQAAGAYPDLGKAPELTNEVWLNSAAPLSLGWAESAK